jgi:crotonobetainyl-CoA:carnitine CoA-transferase CaiB-like acyl-CoA transferase
MKMLEGIKVLDFTQYLSGPTVTRLMAEMGAEIIKIETAPGGDPSRLLPVVVDGRSGYFVQQNRGKQSLCVDLRTEEGLAIVRGLVAKVDVVVKAAKVVKVDVAAKVAKADKVAKVDVAAAPHGSDRGM